MSKARKDDEAWTRTLSEVTEVNEPRDDLVIAMVLVTRALHQRRRGHYPQTLSLLRLAAMHIRVVRRSRSKQGPRVATKHGISDEGLMMMTLDDLLLAYSDPTKSLRGAEANLRTVGLRIMARGRH